MTTEYVGQNIVFADLYNGHIYGGKSMVLPENLQELDITEGTVIDDGKEVVDYVRKFRDVLKQAVIKEDEHNTYVLFLGVENQTKVDYGMPVRNMLYDALTYSRQIKEISQRHKNNGDKWEGSEYLSGIKKSDKLKPVITMVAHFGTEPWDGPCSIYDMFDLESEELKKFIPNYTINLISPVSMSKEEIGKFKSDFRELAELINCAGDKEAIYELVHNNIKYRKMDALTANVASKCLNLKFEIEEEGGDVNMCKALEDLRQDGYDEGREIGYSEGKDAGIKAIVNTLKEIYSDFEVLYSKVIANSIYANLTREDVMKYY